LEDKGYYEGVANRIRIDMDSRSPRLRLSVLGMLLEAGVLSKPEIGHGEEWIAFLNRVVEYIGSGLDGFATSIKEFEPEEVNPSNANSDKERAANDGFGGTILDIKDYDGYL